MEWLKAPSQLIWSVNMADCPYGEADWYCAKQAGHGGPHESVDLAADLESIHAAVAKANIDPSRDILAEMYREDR